MSDYDYVHHAVVYRYPWHVHPVHKASRQWCDNNYNPRHVPYIPLAVHISSRLVVVMKRYQSGPFYYWTTVRYFEKGGISEAISIYGP